MNKGDIINEITSIASSNYSDWYVGITDNQLRRKEEHGNPITWYPWEFYSESLARDIEKYFLGKGMAGDTGGGINPTCVYIFKE